MSSEQQAKLDLIGKILVGVGTLFISIVVTIIGFFMKDSYKTIVENQKTQLAEISEIKKELASGLVVNENHEQRLKSAEAALTRVEGQVDKSAQTIDYITAMIDLKR